jgi:hypothetical protein
MVVIAAHCRNILGDSSPLVFSMNDSIQDSNLRPTPATFIPGFVIPEPIGVRFSIVFTFIPPYLAVVWDRHCAIVFQLDGFWEVCHKSLDDFIFEVFWVHEGKGIVVVHHDNGITLAPDAEHGAVYDIC